MKFPKPAKREKQRRPLRRSKSIRRRIPRRVARETPQERAYKAWVHTRPCVLAACLTFPCVGPIQQSHERDHTGLGLKETNMRSVPMCAEHHGQWGLGYGYFSGWHPESKKEAMRLWIGDWNEAFYRAHPEFDE